MRKEPVRHERQDFLIEHELVVGNQTFAARTSNNVCEVDINSRHKVRACLTECDAVIKNLPHAIQSIIDLLDLKPGNYVKGMVMTHDEIRAKINTHVLQKKFRGITLHEGEEK